LFEKDPLQIVRETRSLINLYDQWLFDEFRRYLGQRIIEIGIGHGHQLHYMTDRELVVGIDTSSESVEYVRRQFQEFSNVDVIEASIIDEDVLFLGKHGFDTALSVNVFEHIENHRLALAHTYQLLIPKGVFILIVPAHQWLFGTIDEAIGHFRRYSKNIIKSEMKRVGFEILELKYVNILGAIAWGVNSRILRQRVPPPGQLRLLNVIIPALRLIEKVIPVPFGVSLLCIAQRK